MASRDWSKRIKSFRYVDSKKRYQESAGDNVPLDLSQDSSLLLSSIFNSLCNGKEVSTGRNLGHLNNLIKILCNIENLSYSLEEMMICLKPALVSDVKEVRAAGIRALRYLINDAEAVILLTTLQLDCYIIKCLDISHFNEVERIHCLRLIRKIIQISKTERQALSRKNSIIPRSFVSCIIAISCDGAEERDRVYRTCLAVLSELVVVEPAVVIECGGLLVLPRAILECHMYRRINESLCMNFSLLLNHPLSRNLLNLQFNFSAIFAPYTDVLYRLHIDIEDSQIRDEQEMRFLASKMAIVSILHTWSGLVHLGHTSALESFLSVLSIPNSTTKRAVLSVLFEIFGINEPCWTDDFSEALESFGPRYYQETWRLTNMFVSSEGKFFLAPNCNPRPDLINSFMALLLSIFLRDNLIQHLVEVVLSTESHASVVACILLGAVLNMCSKLLPNDGIGGEYYAEEKVNDCNPKDMDHSACRNCLPLLMEKATSNYCSREEKLRAVVTISRLQEINDFFNKPASPCSIYLIELLFRVKCSKNLSDEEFEKTQIRETNQSSNSQESNSAENPSTRRNRSLTIMRDFSDDQLYTKIKETHVLVVKDCEDWKWDVISCLLAESWSEKTTAATSLRHVGSDDTVQRFVKRLVNFFLPGSEKFCKQDRAREGFLDTNRLCVQAGCNLVRCLLMSDNEGIKLLQFFTEKTVQYLNKLMKDSDGQAKVSHLFATTCAREYFLLLGAMTAQHCGNEILQQSNAFELFMSLADKKTHDSVIKLVVSSLYYTVDSPSYHFLKKVLISCNETARIYCTSYLRVLLRANVPGFEVWGVNILINQLYDPCNSVAAEALDILNEACDDSKILEVVVSLRPSVLHLGEAGALLVCKFMSHPLGFDYLSESKYLKRELQRWWESANERYVIRVEELINLSLTCFEKPNQQGGFVRRSGIKKKITPVPLPSHIYGELCLHEKGCKVLEEERIVPRLMDKLETACQVHKKISQLNSESVNYSLYKEVTECLIKIKSCLWALAHIGSSTKGLALLQPLGVVQTLTQLAEHSVVHSISGTCFYCLSIIAQTVTGAEELNKFKWLSVSRKSISGRDFLAKNFQDANVTSVLSSLSQKDHFKANSILKPSKSFPTYRNQSSGDEESLSSIQGFNLFVQSTSKPSTNSQFAPNNCEHDLDKSSPSDAVKFQISSQMERGNSSNLGRVYSNSTPELNVEPDDKITRRIYNSVELLTDAKSNMGKNQQMHLSHENLQSIAISEKKQDLWCFTQMKGQSALDIIRTSQFKRQMTYVDHGMYQESLHSSISPVVSSDVCEEIKQSVWFVGIALPEDLNVLFKHENVSDSIAPPVNMIPARIKHKQFSSKQSNPFSTLPAEHCSTSVRSDTTNFLDEISTLENCSEIIHHEILKLVINLGSSVGVKMNETALLVMKEKFPEEFNSTSLYYHVSEILGHYNFRITTRRFIQELFHDVSFSEVYKEAKNVVESHK